MLWNLNNLMVKHKNITVMKSNEVKELRAYERPMAEILVIKFGNICGGIEEGSNGGEDCWEDEPEG